MAGLKRKLAGLLCRPVVGRAVLAVFGSRVPTRGLRIGLGPTPDPRVAARLFWGLYESSEIRFIERFLRDDLDVVELGGSIGVVSSVIGRRLRDGTRLVVVEAVAELVRCIRDNVTRNARKVRLEVVHGAVDYRVPIGDPVPLSVDRDNTKGAVSFEHPTGHQAPALRLSDLLDRQGIGDYALVCDIEGAEWDLIDRDLEAFRRCRQIVLEGHAAPARRHDERPRLLDPLLADGFVERHRRGPVVFLERPD